MKSLVAFDLDGVVINQIPLFATALGVVNPTAPFDYWFSDWGVTKEQVKAVIPQIETASTDPGTHSLVSEADRVTIAESGLSVAICTARPAGHIPDWVFTELGINQKSTPVITGAEGSGKRDACTALADLTGHGSVILIDDTPSNLVPCLETDRVIPILLRRPWNSTFQHPNILVVESIEEALHF